MSQSKDIWLIAQLSDDLGLPIELCEQLRINGTSYKFSTSVEAFASDEGVLYNPDPILALQKMINGLDALNSYKLVIVSHGRVVNGRHVLETTIPKGSVNVGVLMDSADLLNSLNSKFNISETLLFSCFGGAVHKDLAPMPSKIYTIAEAESPCVSVAEIFMEGDNIQTIQDLILSITRSNIHNGLGSAAFIDREDEVSEEACAATSIDDVPKMILSHDNCINHFTHVMLTENSKTIVFDSEPLDLAQVKTALNLIPQSCWYDAFYADLVDFFTNGIDPNLEGKDFELDLFSMLKTHCCILWGLTKEADVTVGDLCNGYDIKFTANESLRNLVFNTESHFLQERFKGFDISRNGYQDVSELQLKVTQIAMDFFPLPQGGGYNFEVYFFPLITLTNPVAVVLSKNVSNEFKDRFFTDEELIDLFAAEHIGAELISDQEVSIFSMLEASRKIMKVHNAVSKEGFNSSSDAYLQALLETTLVYCDQFPEKHASVPEELHCTYYKPQVIDITSESDPCNVNAQEWMFEQLTGSAAEWVDSLIS